MAKKGIKRRKTTHRKNPLSKLRRFYLERQSDVSGISGTGIVAVGVCFPNGVCTMQWQTAIKSLVIYDSVKDVEKVHGHDGKTQLRWID